MDKRTLLASKKKRINIAIRSFIRMLCNEKATALVEYSVVIFILSTIVCFFIAMGPLIPKLYQANIDGMQKVQDHFIKEIP